MKHYNINGPTRVVIEASMDAVYEHDLNLLDNEQYDSINNVIAIEDDGKETRFTTCRSHEAWLRGEPNAGRGVLVIPNKYLERVFIPDNNDDKE
ncbi:MAG TPA: hypothetical protein VNS88_04520 [Nitrospiraceae bacterium]|nr:hypothetical protein [Nitrospiraceae bacterium]